MSKVKELSTVFTIGSVGYSLLEIIWRGFTHWTMTITGGICLVLIYLSNIKMYGKAIWKKCLAGTAIITSLEFSVGIIVNKILDWNVWDYSGRLLNVMGQICPLFSGIWFILCIPLVWLTDNLNKRFCLLKARKT